jgi:CDP-diacylglycerol--glycerol-3-phosphate 3-phosphatidyltransferase
MSADRDPLPLLTPNQITTLRLGLFLAASVALCFPRGLDLALGLVLVGGLSDRLDGWVARKYNLGSEFGKIYDQLSDKVAALLVLTALVERGLLPAWFLGALVLRDFAMSGLRDYLLVVRGEVLAANWLGKRKADVLWLWAMSLLVAVRLDWHVAETRSWGMGLGLAVSYGSLVGYLFRASPPAR